METYFAEPDITLGVYKSSMKDLEKNLPCDAEDNLRARLIVIEAWFRGY